MKLIPPEAEYESAFARECQQVYPMVDAIEQRYGCAIGLPRLEAAARVLACPVKAHPPNWQHGRVLYAVAHNYARRQDWTIQPWPTVLDIGTAKGFSALCLYWALADAHVKATVVSVDVIDPKSATRRNTVAECDGLKTLAETLEPWPESRHITFLHDTGIDYLARGTDRIHIAYIDGKHTHDVAKREGELLAARQQPGDLAIFDDVQIDGVARAVKELTGVYEFEHLTILPHRAYAIGRRW